VFSFCVALIFHVLAGGPAPTAAATWLTLSLAVFVCVALAGRRLSLWRLSVSVTASQALFHWVFSSSANSVMPSASSSTSAVGMHQHHHLDAGSLPMPVLESSGHSHMTASMAASHLIAAALTIAVLHWSETLLARLAQLGRLLWRVIVPLLLTVRLVPRTRTLAHVQHEATFTSQQVPLSSASLRGPPVSAL
jgi:hypothetical protein